MQICLPIKAALLVALYKILRIGRKAYLIYNKEQVVFGSKNLYLVAQLFLVNTLAVGGKVVLLQLIGNVVIK